MILCLETSAKACTVALANEGKLIATKAAEGEWKHSKVITLLIQELLQNNSVLISDLKAVAISKGPGSYTGLRVGASCAKGICYTRKIPLIAIPTLEIIAYPHIGSNYDLIVPMIDARRMEVYYNIYDNTLTPAQETSPLIIEEGILNTLEGKKVRFCGDGAFKMSDYIGHQQGWNISSGIADARHMVELANTRLEGKIFEDVAYYTPFYLKPPNITKSKKKIF